MGLKLYSFVPGRGIRNPCAITLSASLLGGITIARHAWTKSEGPESNKLKVILRFKIWILAKLNLSKNDEGEIKA